MPIFEDYHRTVVGFHGTRRETARRIVSGETSFRRSTNDDDWLGHGIYFWEHAPQQAWAWAKQRYARNTQVAVLGAMIRLQSCFDLLEPANIETLVKIKQQMERDRKALDAPELRQNANARKFYDCSVFQHAYTVLEEQGEPVDTARAVYVPTGNAGRLWNRSWISRNAHIQLCVRNPRCILGAWLVPEKSQ